MIDVVEKLLVIQDRDRRLAQLRAEHGRIPEQMAIAEQRLQSDSSKVEALREQIKHLEADRKKLEIDAEAKRTQIAKYKTQLFQIKSNTEYQALLKEIAKQEQDVDEVETRELDVMEKVEQLQPSMKEEQAAVKEMMGKVQAEKGDLQKRMKVIEQEMEQLKTEREKLAKDADPDALGRYERLIHSKGDFAIVPIRNGNCGGCHLHIPPQLVHNAKLGSELTSCDYCGRILYWQGE